jgi:hypothetical protein
MASASHGVRSDSPVDRWSDEPSVEAEARPVDLHQKNDRRSNKQPALGRRTSRALVRFLITFCLGVATTLAWQSYGDAARKMVASSHPQLGWLAPQTATLVGSASGTTTPAEPAAPSADAQRLKAILLDLAAMRQSVSLDLAAMRQSMDQVAAQLAAGNQQIASDIATLQAAQQAILRKVSAPPPRPATIPARNAVQLTPALSPDAPSVR